VPIDVVELTPPLEPQFAAFVATHARSMIYSTLEFRTFLERVAGGKPRYLAAVDDGRIVGVLPSFVAADERAGTIVNSLPWYGSHGGCLVDEENGDAIRRRLLARYREMIGELDAAFATLIPYPHESADRDVYADVLAPLTTDDRISQVTGLPDGGGDVETQLMQTLRQKTRNLVRKALKQGFTYHLEDTDEGWRFLFETHAANLAAIGGRAKPRSHFDALRETIPAEWRQLAVARLDGAPAAAILLLRFNRTVEYLTPVIEQRFRAMQPLSFAIWHAMLDAVRAGYREWNWGGTWTTQHSLHHFKAGWGATERRYSYFVHASPEALVRFNADRERVCGAFPYYFVFPFTQPAN
jgi:hypothetical protein